MQELAMQKKYTADLVLQIETMGALAVAVANRWIMGWPDRVARRLAAGIYVDCLAFQVEHEKGVLANEANMRHLARHEILQIYEISEAPPC